MRKFLFLSAGQRFGDFTLLLLRVFVGIFLIWSAWDYVSSAEQMREYADSLAKHGFAAPMFFAQVSVFARLAVGVSFIVGFFTRWAGIVCVIHFIVAIVMIDRFGGMRGVFPSGCLVAIGLYLATHGAGRISIDEALRANELPRANGGVRLKK